LQQFIKVVKHHGDFAASIFIYAPQAALQRRWSRVRYLVNYLTQLRRMNANHSLVTLLGFMEVRACVRACVRAGAGPSASAPAGRHQTAVVGMCTRRSAKLLSLRRPRSPFALLWAVGAECVMEQTNKQTNKRAGSAATRLFALHIYFLLTRPTASGLVRVQRRAAADRGRHTSLGCRALKSPAWPAGCRQRR